MKAAAGAGANTGQAHPRHGRAELQGRAVTGPQHDNLTGRQI